MDKAKKILAAIAGVMYYLKSEEEMAVPTAPTVAELFPSPWALNGRQTIMQMRSMVQRRILKR
jgi:hypothetical protein